MQSASLRPSELESQRARPPWQQQQQQQQQHGHNDDIESFLSIENEQCRAGHGWPSLSTTTTTTATATVSKGTKKKRKAADKPPMEEGGGGDKQGEKEQGEKKKPDYIHVRARRGQATDSHSLAERVRRERIGERMKYLQGLVPGCNKITGKAGMLDEIINYVQSLQKQVEFLSMKLATVNPRPEFNMEAFFNKEWSAGGDISHPVWMDLIPRESGLIMQMNLVGDSTISTVGMSSDMIDPSYLLLQQLASYCGYDDTAMHPSELALLRATTTPVSSSEAILDSSFNVHRQQSSAMDNELHSLYGLEFHQGWCHPYPFQSLQGDLLPNNLKMEM